MRDESKGYHGASEGQYLVAGREKLWIDVSGLSLVVQIEYR